MKAMLLRAWRYRYFILSSIQTEFRARFIRSRLGGLWMIIHPLTQAAIFALVMAGMMGARLPGMANNKFAYALYLLSGLLAWSLFSEVISRCLTLFIDNRNLLKKIAFPHISLPLIVTCSALMNYPAASRGVSSSVLARHSVLDTESSRALWIPASAGMTRERVRAFYLRPWTWLLLSNCSTYFKRYAHH